MNSSLGYWGGLNAFYWPQIFTPDHVVVNIQYMYSSHGGNASSQRNNLIKSTHYDEKKKMAHDS